MKEERRKLVTLAISSGTAHSNKTCRRGNRRQAQQGQTKTGAAGADQDRRSRGRPRQAQQGQTKTDAAGADQDRRSRGRPRQAQQGQTKTGAAGADQDRRSRGRPRTMWLENITELSGYGYVEATRKAQDRNYWRQLIATHPAMDGEHNRVVRVWLCGGNKEGTRQELLVATHCIRPSNGWGT